MVPQIAERSSVRALRSFLVTFGLVVVAGGLHAVELVPAGMAVATIAPPDDRLPVERLAAQELRTHLEIATGARLPLVPEAKAPRQGTWRSSATPARPAALRPPQICAFARAMIY
jgi:hypothetical protein